MFNKIAVLRGNKQKWLKYVEIRWALGQGGFLVSYWLETKREIHRSGLHFLLLFKLAENVSNPL
jgi:hypothetical protein